MVVSPAMDGNNRSGSTDLGPALVNNYYNYALAQGLELVHWINILKNFCRWQNLYQQGESRRGSTKKLDPRSFPGLKLSYV